MIWIKIKIKIGIVIIVIVFGFFVIKSVINLRLYAYLINVAIIFTIVVVLVDDYNIVITDIFQLMMVSLSFYFISVDFALMMHYP